MDVPDPIDLTRDDQVLEVTNEELFGPDARLRPRYKKTKSDITTSTGGSSSSGQFGDFMTYEFRLKREAVEKAYEVSKEKDRTVIRLEEMKFLAISTKDLSERVEIVLVYRLWYAHIIDFYDVGGDENYRFRSVILGLGLSEDQWPQVRSDLVRELMAQVRSDLVRELTAHREQYKFLVPREEMMDWAKTIAYSLGYVLVSQRSKKYKNGFIWKVHLMCDRSGKYDGLESSIGTSTKKTDCPFQFIRQYSSSHGYWTIRVVCDQHNHLPTPNLEGHAYARRLSHDEYRLVEDLTWKNVRPREILSTLKDQNENNLSTLSTIYDAQRKIRKVENAGKTPMQVLMSLLHINRYVYEPFINLVTNELQALFFVHPTSYEIWRAFPQVLIIDATYKTNIYKMAFVQIVGVTSTGKTFCIAFVFIIEEKTDNYKWALEQLKLTLNECMSPRVIVMDRELALMKACKIVFPHASRLLCRWHIENFHPHIIDFYDVRGDRNCGFRSVALGLGLSEDQWPQVHSGLVRELTAHREQYKYVFGSLGYDNIYKTVKTTGIASAYNRVVICLADGGSVGASTICFPLWSSPPQSQPRENIVITHVNGNPYIRVTLQEVCPLPLTHPLWLSYRSDVASRWEYPYLSRQDEFREYHYRAPQAYDIS
nr:hypothetical protein [Tanacetum cinerariifolium]